MSTAVRNTTAASGTVVIGLVTASHFVNDNFTSLLGPLQPAIAETYKVTLVETGVLVSLLALVGSVIQPIFGAMGDRVDRRWLAAAGPVLTAFGMTLMGYAPNIYALGLLVVIGGLGSAIFHPSGAAYVAANSNVQKRGLYASIFSAGGTAGLALGPFTATALGLHGLVWLMPLGLAMGIASFLFTPSTRAARQTERAKTRGLADYLEVFQGPIRTLWGVSVLRSLSTVTYGSLIPFLFKARGESDFVIAATLASFSLASAIGGIVGGQLSDRLGRITILRSSVSLLIPLFVALILVSPSSIGIVPFLILAFIVGGLANATIPVAIVAAQEYAPGHNATASALMMGFSWGTAGVVYILFAGLAKATSPNAAMLATVALLIPAFFLTLRLPEPPRAKLS
jgi:FSR family fosmidomycin resistance protein-like MFS transporter